MNTLSDIEIMAILASMHVLARGLSGGREMPNLNASDRRKMLNSVQEVLPRIRDRDTLSFDQFRIAVNVLRIILGSPEVHRAIWETCFVLASAEELKQLLVQALHKFETAVPVPARGTPIADC